MKARTEKIADYLFVIIAVALLFIAETDNRLLILLYSVAYGTIFSLFLFVCCPLGAAEDKS